jgi:drug/metabolite transporter (DMT)-like permease
MRKVACARLLSRTPSRSVTGEGEKYEEEKRLRGVVLFACATVMFASLDATSKYLSNSFPIGFIAWCRYTVHFVVMTALLAPRMGSALYRTGRPAAQVLRGLSLVALTLLMIAAFQRMPLAEATAVIFASPLLVTLLAGPVLGERVDALRIVVALIGFGGVFLITGPSSGLDPVGTACALTASVAYAGYQLGTRALSRTESPITLLYYTAVVGTVVLTCALPWLGLPPTPTPQELVLLLALGFFGATGHYLLNLAFQAAPASLLTPLIYVQLVWATGIGMVVFHQTPGVTALLGAAVVAGAGLVVAWSAQRK